ncbi:MAG: hypothetical protein MSC31_05245 [Solirubrobacteraceae bacterium MAG38_C4-C5]|nr:hypothetical protein [Candidatus Siliceabacter maunaloa]
MSESSDSEPTEAIEHIRTEEPQAPFGADEPNPNVVSDETLDEQGPGEDTSPGAAGYAGRDPATDMPAVPSAPETQDDPQSHDAAPDGGGKGPGAHE